MTARSERWGRVVMGKSQQYCHQEERRGKEIQVFENVPAGRPEIIRNSRAETEGLYLLK